jgi:hypothetical protein
MAPDIHDHEYIPEGGTGVEQREFISMATISNDATIDFTGLGDSRYRYYEFLFLNVLPATDNAQLDMKASSDNGTTWVGGTSYEWGIQYNEPITLQDQGAQNAAVITLTNNQANLNISNVAGEGGLNGWVRTYYTYLKQDHTTISHVVYPISFSQSRCASILGVGTYKPSSKWDATQFLASSGNLTSGEIYCYGVI